MSNDHEHVSLDDELPPAPKPAPVAPPAPARAKLSPSGADVRAAVLNQMISAELKTKFAALDADDASWLIAALVSSACEEKIGRIAGDMQQRVSLSLSGTDSASLKLLFADVVDERVGSAVHAAVKGSVGLAVDKSIDRHFAGLVDSQNECFYSLSKSINKICGDGAGPGVDLVALERTVERAVERRPAGAAAAKRGFGAPTTSPGRSAAWEGSQGERRVSAAPVSSRPPGYSPKGRS